MFNVTQVRRIDEESESESENSRTPPLSERPEFLKSLNFQCQSQESNSSQDTKQMRQ